MSEEAIFRAIHDLQARYSNISELIKKVSDHIQKNENKIDDVISLREKQNIIINDLKNSIDKTFKITFDEVTRLKNEIDKLNIENKAESAISEMIMKRIHNDECEIKVLKEQIISLKEYVADSIQYHKCDLRIEFGQFIASLPKPKIPSSDDILSAIQLKVEPVSIDAKNACLRSANNDMRLGIAEKKIEQLFLLLQRHSLNQ